MLEKTVGQATFFFITPFFESFVKFQSEWRALFKLINLFLKIYFFIFGSAGSLLLPASFSVVAANRG